jgi:hypothetical protein
MKTITQFKGYNSKVDPTKLKEGYLVAGSQNVLSTDDNNVKIREGYELLGAANTALNPIESSYDWNTHSATELNLRAYDDELELLIGGTWTRVKDSWSSVNFKFVEWWNTTESQDELVFINGDSNLYTWSGGVTTIASSAMNIAEAGDASNQLSAWAITGTVTTSNSDNFVLYYKLTDSAGDRTVNIYKDSAGTEEVMVGTRTGDGIITLTESNSSGLTGVVTVAYTGDDTTVSANTLTITWGITKNGTATWAEARFNTAANKKIMINGTEYTYTGGEATTTLTGVTPNPSGEAEDSNAIQSIVTVSNTPASGTNNDVIGILNNQIYIGDFVQRTIYICAQNDYTTWSPSSPRVPGEAAELTLDGFPKGFIVQEDSMYITGGTDEWYKIDFILSSDNTAEAVTINRLKTSTGEAAHSQSAICNIKNDVAFITQEPGIDTLGRLENIDTPRSKPISNDIKTELEGYNLTNVDTKYYRNNIYFALPSESLVLVYNLQEGYWEAPQVLPVRKLAIIDGVLCGHSNAVPETYKLFTGHNDNGNPIEAIAKFSYLQYGDRDRYKTLDEWFTEGYISSNTDLTLELNYDYNGATSVQDITISGANEKMLFTSAKTIGLGKSVLGSEPLGTTTDEIEDLSKFRIIDTMVKQDFFEIQPTYKTNQIDANWKLLAFGSNANYSSNEPITIKN